MTRKPLSITGVLALISIFCFFLTQNAQEPPEGQLWPESKPYKTGYLQVSKLHSIFYQLGGNPNGKSVIVLHSGPGLGCTPFYFRYFNPEKFHIIIHDQRGAGESKPHLELKENTTQDLVEDIEKLRKHLKQGKVILFGGSWGAALALAYGEAYPGNVSGMILREVFLGTKEEIDYFYHGGTAAFFPKIYQKLIDLLEYPNKPNLPAQLLEKLQSPDANTRMKYARAFASYESKVAFLEIEDKLIEDQFKTWDPYPFALIKNYYMTNGCFFTGNQLLENAHKLVDIPIIMINGRYDVINPPLNAYKLHQKLPKSKLVIVEKAGHASMEQSIQNQLLLAAKEFE